MKKVIIAGFLMMFAFANKSFAQAYETSVEMKSGYQNAVSVDVPYLQDEAEKALEKRFEAGGLKGKNFSKGFTEYKNVKFSEFGSQTISIYTKVEPKTKKSVADSKVYVAVTDDSGAFVTSATNERLISNVKRFLDNFEPYAALYNTNVKTTEQGNAIKKAEKELQNLTSDSISLVKNKEKLLQKIKENEENLVNKRKEIDMKHEVLHDLNLQKSEQEKKLPF